MRIHPVIPGTRPELAALEAQIQAARGRISALYQVLLNSPSVAAGWEQMLSAVRNHNSLPPALREMIILRVAVLNRASFEYDAHAPLAKAAGVGESTIASLGSVDMGAIEGLSEREKIALRYTDAMTRDIEVPDALFAEVKANFDAQALIDLTATIAAYNMVSRFLVALHVGH